MRTRDIVKKNLQPIIFVIVTFGLMVSISYATLREMLRRQLLYNAETEMSNIETNIKLKLSESEITLVNAVIVITHIIENGGSNKDILDYFITVTERMKGKNDRAIAFKSLYGYINREYLDGALWDPLNPVSGFLDKDGNLLPFVPQERAWYIAALEAENNAITFTQPYIEAMVGTFVMSVSAKVEIAGEVIGAVSTNVDIDLLKKYVREIAFSEGGYGILLDGNLNIMAHRDQHLINVNMRDAGGDYVSIAKKLAEGGNLPKAGTNTGVVVSSHRMTDIDGTDVIVFFHRLNNCYIGVITPVRSYYSALTHTAVTLTTLGLIFSAVLIFLLIKFSAAKMISDAKDRSKSTFLAKMSHEIRTPMNAIIGIAQIQLQQENLPKECEDGFGRIYNSANGLLGIINDILDLSKIETGKLELNPAEYDTPSLINDAAQMNAVKASSKEIEFTVDANSSLPSKLYGDELRIKQILNNLLSNAIKYTDKGYVKLSISHIPLSEEDVTLKISVEDSGQGIKPEDKAKLFSEYRRLNTAVNHTTEGTGLGLSITKHLVEMMNGKIEAESEYGKGSVFTVEIVQKNVPCEAIGADVSERLKSFSFIIDKEYQRWEIGEIMPYGKILIVDDAETNLFVARGLLTLWKLNIETAQSGFEAIDLIKSGKVYDIVFMDHMMPKMDGIEATQRIRGLGYENAIVALTANALTGNEAMFKARGFDGFVSKPIEITRLSAVLNKFVRDRHPEETKRYKTMADAGENAEITVSMTDMQAATRASQTATPQMLKVFRRDAEKAVAALRETAKNGDIKLYATIAHAMKSALANIGEKENSQLAAELEKAGRDGDSNFISDNTENFIKILEELIKTIPNPEEAANEDDENISEDTVFLAEQLQIIASACENYDNASARRAFNTLNEKTWKQATARTLETLNTAIFQHSEFEGAAEMIRKFLRSGNHPR